MKSVHKSVLIWHSAQEMYDLVTGVDRYPEFLPWCDHSKILAQTETEMTAEVGIAIAGVKQSFVTRNEHQPGRQVRLHLVRGPFSSLDGLWQFTPIGQVGQEACRVELTLDYDFSSRLLEKVVGPVFDRIANNLVDAFVKRADALHRTGSL
jgi:ribosome-associated toxin RatA of RatAB toxin-antitoxin module